MKNALDLQRKRRSGGDMNEAGNVFDNNELAAFVEATLKAISAGIRRASKELKDQTDEAEMVYDQFSAPNAIRFDVAISVKREDSSAGGLKLQVFSIGGGVDGKTALHSETVSRVSFDVPWKSTLTEKGQEDAERTSAKYRTILAGMDRD